MDLSTWWWVAAAILVAAELLTGTFYLLVLAAAAAVAAVASHLGIGAWGQIGAAGLVTAIGSYLVHEWHKKHGNKDNPTQYLDVGQQVTVDSWIDSQNARVKYRGSVWNASLDTSATQGQSNYRIKTLVNNQLVIH